MAHFVLRIVLLSSLSVCGSATWRFHGCADKASLKERYVRWFAGFGWTNIDKNDTALCQNLTATLHSKTFAGLVDEFSGGYGYAVVSTGLVDHGQSQVGKACMLSIQKDLGIKVAPVIGGGECYPHSASCPTLSIASDVNGFVENATATVMQSGWAGLSTDFESKYDYVNQSMKREISLNFSRWYAGLSETLESKGASAGLSRWAGCVHNGLEDYMNMTCAEFAHLAPKVHLLAMGTYWDNSPDGFENLVLDSIISTSNTAPNRWNDWQHHLSPALCPLGCNDAYKPNQSELYDRMDLMCALGFTDITIFDWANVATMANAGDLRYPNAIRYFRTGVRTDDAFGVLV